MAVSTVPAVIAYLLTKIIIQVNDTTVLVQVGTAGSNQPPDMILIGDVVRRSLIFDTLGPASGLGSVVEHYSVDVGVSSFLGGDDPTTVFNRAATLADAVVAVLRNDPTLGGNVAAVGAEPIVADSSVDWDTTGEGRLAEVKFSFTVDAYI